MVKRSQTFKVTVIIIGWIIVYLGFMGNLISAVGENDNKYITIAYVGGLTGRLSQASRRALNALELAVEEANLKGGARGRLFRVVSFDNKNSAINNYDLFDEILKSGAVAVTGIHVSDDGLILSMLAEKKQLPVVVASATHPNITKGKRFTVRVCFNDDMQGQFLANIAFNKFKKRNALLVVNASDSFSIYLSRRFEEVFKRLGGNISYVVNTIDGEVEYKQVIDSLARDTTIDLIFLSTSALESGYLINILSSNGIKKTILGSDGWQSDHLDTLLANLKSSHIDAYYTAHWYKNMKDIKTAAFIRKYNMKFNDDTSSFDADAVLTYDAGVFLTTAIKNSPNLNSDEIMKSIQRTHINGLTGDIKMSNDGNPSKAIYVMKIVDGKTMFYMAEAK